MEKLTTETKAFMRLEKKFNEFKKEGESNVYRFPWFADGFNEGEKSMVAIHSNLLNLVKEYLFLFQDEKGLVNHAFQKEIDKIEELIQVWL